MRRVLQAPHGTCWRLQRAQQEERHGSRSVASNAAEHRTLVLARQEMAAWTQLQLEPTALRAPDEFTAPHSIGHTGAHLPATLHELAQAAQRDHPGGERDVYARIANKLSELVENVRDVAVDVDEKRQLLSIVMTDLQNTEHVAGALSDGTLRFLALTVMQADPRSRRLLCLEEPENGMHPLRIPAVIALLRELAVDAEEAVDADNPLRQVIVNTHSPSVVACVRDDALLVAHAERDGGSGSSRLSIRHLPQTWRDGQGADEPTVTRGDLLAYLNPLRNIDDTVDAAHGAAPRARTGRRTATSVMHRTDMQPNLPLTGSHNERGA